MCIISTLCTALWPVVALRCEVNNWMGPLINKVQGERRRGGKERGEMGETGHSSLQSPCREWYDCKHTATFLSELFFLPRRCLDIISISCSELWLWAWSRMWHFNTFPLSSTGTRLLPVKQVEGGNMELPLMHWPSLPSTRPNSFPVGLCKFQLAVCYKCYLTEKHARGTVTGKENMKLWF